VAAQRINAGDHVHTHNLKPVIHNGDYWSEESERSFESFAEGAQDLPNFLEGSPGFFNGFLRPDGRVGTRNYIVVIASVQCAAQVCHRIASHFNSVKLERYPNVDGVIALTHNGGCGQADYCLLQRTLIGMATHPNTAAALLVGLGCEGNQLVNIKEADELAEQNMVVPPRFLEIQPLGGSRKTIQAGIDAVESMLPEADQALRSPQSLSKLSLAVECGGSDSWSGITANPLIGRVADFLIHQGGTVAMAETPEVFGAEHLLLKRSANPKVEQRFIEKLNWWRDYVIRIGASLENNPSPGNKVGGLTNICEKSLGAIVKSGSTPMNAVYDYAETIREQGFVFMDSPGNDPVSVTGMVAGGCNLILFSTGRGSVFGFKPAPSLKICTNTRTFERMIDDMDFNAGRLFDEEVGLEMLASELFQIMVATASGSKTKSEVLGLGEMEFVPWFREGFI
jgi:altronate dehydratase